ncbi:MULTISPECIES: alpha/beta hydrolase [Ramlibacter]|uniref:Alpha/beta fold hydrolase n=1 Tax=Ramlibacter aquaticus TaxID=2780094 RepID=A0ABR9SB16_9BURK|nr:MULTISPECIES: alpha/beta hydrolase [Ramlibacter]MBE7938972.1 alpha/beta fold hydrolase [Ramlibacter aquaticus]
MSLVVFSHANSFPASTYAVLFRSLRARGFTVKAVEKFGHDPAYPVTDNWPQLVRQLHDFAAREVERAGEKAWFVGHSLGGFLSMLTAAAHPRLARGVVLIDSPLLGGWKATALGAVKKTPLVGAVTPGRVSRKRKNRWPSVEDALAHFQSKRAFAHWDPQVLRDYVAHGTHEEEGERVLSFDRDVETQIYNTLPDDMPAYFRRHPPRCPAAFIGGLQSEELRRVGLAMTQQFTHGRMAMLDGSHLFPMEKPIATAAAIEAALRGMGA